MLPADRLDYTIMAVGLILAAGQGTRLGALGERLPKSLLYLPGGTLLDYQLQLLDRVGIRRVYVVVRHQAQLIADHLRGRPGIELVYQDHPPTLEGALLTAGLVVEEPCLVLHGDNYVSFLPHTLLEALEHAPRVFYEGEVGIYGLRPEHLRRAAAGDGLESLREGALQLPLPGWRRNINRLADLLEVNDWLLDHWYHGFHLAATDRDYWPAGPPAELQPPCWISHRAELRASRLGPYVTVGAAARLEEARLERCVVFPGARRAGVMASRAVLVGEEIHPAG